MLSRHPVAIFEGGGILDQYQMQRPQRQSCLPADAVLDEISASLSFFALSGHPNRFSALAFGENIVAHMGQAILSCKSGLGGNWDFGKRSWSSGRILACHAGGPGSIPGLRIFLQKLIRSICFFLRKN